MRGRTAERVRRSVGWIALLVLAGIFGYAGVIKIIDPVGFYGSILDYRLVDGSFAVMAAVVLPVFEVVLAAGLLFPRWRMAARAWIGLLLIFFLIAIGQAWARGIDLSCGCFGSGEAVAPWTLILRDIGMLVLVGLVPGGREGSRADSSESEGN